MTPQRILFIINPIAGVRQKDKLPALARELLPASRFRVEVHETTGPGDATKAAAQAAADGFDVVAACGGDGTINEVGQGLLHTQTAMAIVPGGSGNGLARHLKLPLQPAAAIKRLHSAAPHPLDVGFINGRPFFNVSGIGFDAHVGEAFSRYSARGFFSYARAVLTTLANFQPAHVEIRTDAAQFSGETFLVSFANSSQYGNGAYINPGGRTDDGLIELCVLKPFPLLEVPQMLNQLFNGRMVDCEHMTVLHAREATVTSPEKGLLHIDGEPCEGAKELKLTVEPGALKVMV